MKPRKVPMRMCVGCREMKPKRELIRVVKPKEGEAQMDPGGKLPGRGAYVCKSRACLARAFKTKQLERALSYRIDTAVLEVLEAQVESADEG